MTSQTFDLAADTTTGIVATVRKVCFYGPQGIGKSTIASQAPDPYFFSFEEGTNDLDVRRTKLITSVDQYKSYAKQLLDNLSKLNVKTLVIDGVDGLDQCLQQSVVDHFNRHDEKLQANPAKSINDIGYGKGWKELEKKWHIVCKYSFSKFIDAGVHVVLLAHSGVRRIDEPDKDPFDRYDLRIHEKAAYHVRAWLDEMFFCTYLMNTRKDGNKNKAIGKYERAMFCEPCPQYEAKHRLKSIPAELPMSWDAYAQHLTGVK